MTERDPLLALEHALTDAERATFDAYVRNNWPRLAGASIADVLEHTTSYDMFLDQTEPFFEAHGDQLPAGAPSTAALHLLIILGGELTMGRLLRLLADAGLCEAGEFPRTEVRYLIEGMLDGKPWVVFAPNAGDTEEDARSVYGAWKTQRDAQGAGFRYRLVKRISTDELLDGEKP